MKERQQHSFPLHALVNSLHCGLDQGFVEVISYIPAEHCVEKALLVVQVLGKELLRVELLRSVFLL